MASKVPSQFIKHFLFMDSDCVLFACRGGCCSGHELMSCVLGSNLLAHQLLCFYSSVHAYFLISLLKHAVKTCDSLGVLVPFSLFSCSFCKFSHSSAYQHVVDLLHLFTELNCIVPDALCTGSTQRFFSATARTLFCPKLKVDYFNYKNTNLKK